jgi:hypothetical protein
MAKLVGTGNTPVPVTFAANADHYRLIGLEITNTLNNPSYAAGTMIIGGNQASKIIIDRCWVHGMAQAETRRGIWMSGWTYAAVIDSYFTDFHCNQNGQCGDAQAIAGGTGNYAAGPIKIVNNFIEAAAEGTIWGGDAGTTIPADLEMRRNHYWKPFQWQSGNAGYIAGTGGSGGSMIVKNHFELKNSLRTLFEGNLLENVWGGFSQQGYPFMVTPVNQGGTCSVCSVNDTVIRYNKSSHSGGGMVWVPNAAPAGGSSRRLVFHDNVMDDVDNVAYAASGVLFSLFNGWADNNWGDTQITHNTALPLNTALSYPHNVLLDQDTTYGNLTGLFNFSNNLYANTPYPWWAALGVGNGCGNSDQPLTMLNTCFPGGWASTNNALVGSTAGSVPSCPVAVGACRTNAAQWPGAGQGAVTYFPADWSAVQFVNYNNGNGGNYALQSGSPYHNAASDGKDIGADIAAVNAAIAGVQ